MFCVSFARKKKTEMSVLKSNWTSTKFCKIWIHQIADYDVERYNLWRQCAHHVGEAEFMDTLLLCSKGELALRLTLDAMDHIVAWAVDANVNIEKTTRRYLEL